jgi:hypothetical protein
MMAQQDQWEARELYGGVFRVQLPTSFKDIRYPIFINSKVNSSHVPITDN